MLGLPGVPVTEVPPASGVDPSFAILHGLYWLCANVTTVGPLCLVVDDAHWADAASLRYLAFLLTRLDELDAALVVATRPHEPGTDAALLATVTSDPSADVIRVPPLTRAAVAELVESRLGTVPDPRFVDACLRATRGTPFLLRVLVEALSEGSIAPTAEAARHVDRIGARGRSLDAPSFAGSRRMRGCSLGRWRFEEGDLLQAAQLAGLDELEAAHAAELLTTAGILEPGRPLAFIHPSSAAGSIRSSPATSARSATAVLRDCSPINRALTRALPSTCWSASRPPTAGLSSGSWRPRGRRSGTALPSQPPSSCAESSPSRP